MNLTAFYLKSPLTYNPDMDASNRDFIGKIGRQLGCTIELRDFSLMENGDLPLVFVATGGTEGIFRSGNAIEDYCYLLTSGANNSLAASMEILSYLNLKNKKGEIIHGSIESMAQRIKLLLKIHDAKQKLDGMKLGAVGAPSDWLIASDVDCRILKAKTGMEIVDITIAELVQETEKKQYNENEYTKQLIATGYNLAELEKAFYIYGALCRICEKYSLSAITVRCFDLLSGVKATSCLALAMLNAQGIYAGCEGDMQSLVSMIILGTLSQAPVFMCNPSRLSPQTDKMVFAHCTLPLNMPEKYTLDTHFESGIGVAIAGDVPSGPATLFKCSGDLARHMACRVEVTDRLKERNLCRTQIEISLPHEITDYFLQSPIGNHHLLCCGDFSYVAEEFFKWIK